MAALPEKQVEHIIVSILKTTSQLGHTRPPMWVLWPNAMDEYGEVAF